MISWLFNWFFRKRVDELNEIQKRLEEKIKSVDPVYTTIRSYSGIDAEYYRWVCNTLSSREFHFFLFDIREAIVRGLTTAGDKELAMRYLGRLDTLDHICEYLKRYKAEYEIKIRGNSENP